MMVIITHHFIIVKNVNSLTTHEAVDLVDYPRAERVSGVATMVDWLSGSARRIVILATCMVHVVMKGLQPHPPVP